MTFLPHRSSSKAVLRLVSILVSCNFILTSIIPPAYSKESTFNLPIPGAMISTSSAFTPMLLKGLVIHPSDPMLFDFIVDTGDTNFLPDEVKVNADKLIKYFFASMTVPQNDFWVNLSPYEKNRIIPNELGKTSLGRDLLAQDYILKQLTASLMCPEGELGKVFWQKVYKKAQEKYNISNIPTDTFNKVWILPESASVYEKNNTVYIVGGKLKVMLEEDYNKVLSTKCLVLSKKNKQFSAPAKGGSAFGRYNLELSTLLREIIIPEIEKEVNEGKNFAQLRQIYYSLILAKWYKEVIKNSVLSKVYIDKNKVSGVELDDKSFKDKIYNQYLDAYKKGVYNYIKEEYDSLSQTVIPKKYFSGGIVDKAINMARKTNVEDLALVQTAGNNIEVVARLLIENTAPASDSSSSELKEEDKMKVRANDIIEMMNYLTAVLDNLNNQNLDTIKKDIRFLNDADTKICSLNGVEELEWRKASDILKLLILLSTNGNSWLNQALSGTKFQEKNLENIEKIDKEIDKLILNKNWERLNEEFRDIRDNMFKIPIIITVNVFSPIDNELNQLENLLSFFRENYDLMNFFIDSKVRFLIKTRQGQNPILLERVKRTVKAMGLADKITFFQPYREEIDVIIKGTSAAIVPISVTLSMEMKINRALKGNIIISGWDPKTANLFNVLDVDLKQSINGLAEHIPYTELSENIQKGKYEITNGFIAQTVEKNNANGFLGFSISSLLKVLNELGEINSSRDRRRKLMEDNLEYITKFIAHKLEFYSLVLELCSQEGIYKVFKQQLINNKGFVWMKKNDLTTFSWINPLPPTLKHFIDNYNRLRNNWLNKGLLLLASPFVNSIEVHEKHIGQHLIDFLNLPALSKLKDKIKELWGECLPSDNSMNNTNDRIESVKKAAAPEEKSKDVASLTVKNIEDESPGGIDFNNISVQRKGSGIDIKFDEAEMNRAINSDKFTPVIINVAPIKQIVPFILGKTSSGE